MVRDDAATVRPKLLRPAALGRRTLDELIEEFGGEHLSPAEGADLKATVPLGGLAVASLDVAPGDLFVALPGCHAHGARFATDAATAGAVAVLTDQSGAQLAAASGLPVVLLERLRAQLAAISSWMYQDERTPPQLFGVTGTNGKTSATYLLHALLEQLGVVAGLSSTAERRIRGRVVASRLTTPEAPELQALLAAMREEGAEAIAVEVSAHGVSRARVDHVLFDVVGFTNLSHDHLDEYPSMDAYFAAKAALFTPAHTRRAVVSVETPYGQRLAAEARVPVTTISSHPGVNAAWRLRVTDSSAESTGFELTAPDGQQLRSRVSLIGRHMAANTGLAIAMLVEAGYRLDAIRDALAADGLQVEVPGRGVRVSGATGPLVLLDFSHNGAAFEHTLTGLRKVTPGTLTMVMGADGDRDPSKRELMGRMSSLHSDVLIVTDHHPRHEDPSAIRAALLAGAARADDRAEVLEIPDPAAAIRTAIARSGQGDTILWAGPGLTDYRIIGAERLPYSPREDARRALDDAGWPTVS
ncbi:MULTISPECIES: Mur ligase family protein [unclassified Pseudoclavibacter]|uniref:Mur ligase family protein n=1 Tax=unclassified Pseudoclavibacter TaxID=2615177 RepID=UPI002015F044|nr:UDP-N-acetylmuramoyl-L-alanyl-D-glutamate--2,6-diaminopimelate ligase [Pseudoclavibacter sp. Marseille-Q4354]